MNYFQTQYGSRMRAFTVMLETYFDMCLEKGKDSYETISFIDETWGDRIEEWGWNLPEFLTLMLEFYEGLQTNRI